jgi:acetyl esterase/lipase
MMDTFGRSSRSFLSNYDPIEKRVPMCPLAMQGIKRLFRIRLLDECPVGDQGVLYAKSLASAGVQTRRDYRDYQGLPNMFVQFPELPSTLKAEGIFWRGLFGFYKRQSSENDLK